MTLYACAQNQGEELLQTATDMLRKAGVESPRREARLLLAHCLSIPPRELVSRAVDLSGKEAEAFLGFVNRRCSREPLAYITGRREFWSLEFSVSPAVLIPRPESEVLVETALREFPQRGAPLRVLDLGTGSGCLLLAFLSERPNADGLGIDLSEHALPIADQNARTLSLHNRAEFSCCDWVSGIEGEFDVVFANPPYVQTDDLHELEPELAYEPICALDGGADGLDAYREIAKSVRPRLNAGAALFLEIGKDQANAVHSIFSTHGFYVTGTVSDLSGIPRCVIVRA